jgi:hypothetical protein
MTARPPLPTFCFWEVMLSLGLLANSVLLHALLLWQCGSNLPLCQSCLPTIRKPKKTNGITDRIFPLVIYTDGNNSVSKSLGIYRRNKPVGETISIYQWKYFVGIYRRFRRRGIQFVWKYATAWWRQVILPMELPRDSNWYSRIVTWHFHRWNHRWNHRQK